MFGREGGYKFFLFLGLPNNKILLASGLLVFLSAYL
jgi:hypothetical protein